MGRAVQFAQIPAGLVWLQIKFMQPTKHAGLNGGAKSPKEAVMKERLLDLLGPEYIKGVTVLTVQGRVRMDQVKSGGWVSENPFGETK